ncbi:universal stress protein [Paraburkholderia sp. JHI2823]|uniref:universal stress protein n=1 Tax=Paraburkholderia sp. JHI2823 TaxID=3112960 RepID=UPI00317C028B
MELPSKPFHRLMATAEGGRGLALLAAFACRLAGREAPVRLVELTADPAALFPALQLGLPDSAATHAAMIRRAELDLREAADALALDGCKPDVQLLDLAVLHTKAPVAIARAADAFDADLVALAAHRPGHHWACRLDPEEIAYATRRTLLYVPSQLLALDAPPLARALIAVDGSASAYAALELAVRCLPAEVELRVIHVVERTLHVGGPELSHLFEDGRASALSRARSLVASCGARVSLAALATHDEFDDIASAILREVGGWGADMLVIGLQGRRIRAQTLPGSVASRALRDARCPVLVAAPANRAADQPTATRESYGASRHTETSVPSLSAAPCESSISRRPVRQRHSST